MTDYDSSLQENLLLLLLSKATEYNPVKLETSYTKVIPSYTKVIPSYTKVIPSYTMVIPSYTKLYQVIPSYTKVIPSYTKLYHGYTKLYHGKRSLNMFSSFNCFLINEKDPCREYFFLIRNSVKLNLCLDLETKLLLHPFRFISVPTSVLSI